MNKRQKWQFYMEAFILALLFTCTCFYFFPQYICTTVYLVNASEVAGEDWKNIWEDSTFTEEFIPKQKYLTSIGFHVGENEEGNLLLGKLCDISGKVLAEHIVKAEKGFVTFEIQKWVDTDEKYTFSVTGHESNTGVVPITFGETVKGSEEHVLSWEDGIASRGNLWTQYVYSTYSKKLLLLWFAAFLVVSFWIMEIVWTFIKSEYVGRGENRPASITKIKGNVQ